MKNNKLLEKVKDNKNGHVIFESQNSQDLKELKDILNEKDQIVVEFNKDE